MVPRRDDRGRPVRGGIGCDARVQNHAPVIKDHKDVLRMVREVNSPNLKVCLDAGIMPDKRPEVIRQAAREVGSLQVLSHFGGEYQQSSRARSKVPSSTGSSSRRCARLDTPATSAMNCATRCRLLTAGRLASNMPKKNAQLACRYMRDLIERSHS